MDNDPNYRDPDYRADRTDRVVSTTVTVVTDGTRPSTNTTVVDATTPADRTGMTVAVVIGIIVLAIAGYFFYANRTNQPVFSSSTVSNGVSSAVSKTKDGAAEVPQAAKDAMTKGDQDTTRPNKDNSTNQLDQKPTK